LKTKNPAPKYEVLSGLRLPPVALIRRLGVVLKLKIPYSFGIAYFLFPILSLKQAWLRLENKKSRPQQGQDF
jgi:hypothetical protein